MRSGSAATAEPGCLRRTLLAALTLLLPLASSAIRWHSISVAEEQSFLQGQSATCKKLCRLLPCCVCLKPLSAPARLMSTAKHVPLCAKSTRPTVHLVLQASDAEAVISPCRRSAVHLLQ